MTERDKQKLRHLLQTHSLTVGDTYGTGQIWFSGQAGWAHTDRHGKNTYNLNFETALGKLYIYQQEK